MYTNSGENLVNHEYGEYGEIQWLLIFQNRTTAKNKIKGWQKGKFRTTKKEKKKKREKREAAEHEFKKGGKKQNKNRKLTAVYYCVAYSFALRSRQTKEVLGGSSAAFSCCCCCCGPSSLCLRGGHPEAVFREPTETTPRASLLLHSADAAASRELTRIVILLTRWDCQTQYHTHGAALFLPPN
jgi:hypothetical protein